MQQSKDDRSLGELFADLARDTGTLVSQEVALAKTELAATASRVGKDLAFLAVGGLVAYAGLLAIVGGVIAVLAANGVPLWASALVVGVIVALIGAVLVRRGLAALQREEWAPRQTMESLKEDTQWAKEQVR